ncbi:Sec7-domain-containing protein [Laetiporus sulphureus 93-53]|uniref:Sec7-domain-containing protein n=1 Tax=Laetiporus sulphureus 93-53 TaxID=1314785 RepID=A0A165CVR9_9APHY|nr:Sec7-domain-containing protein [Laetiporus sulphureus 93-53]KZT03523.1 Sec7-domain-containing protein [Laetiporus sulphureus 93-53]
MNPAYLGMPHTGSVSMKHILLSEILSVTSVMRKNSRWALSTHSHTTRESVLASSLGLRRMRHYAESNSMRRGTTEQELMAGFQDLKRVVKDADDVRLLPLTTLLSPFSAIIRSPLSTGPITSTALSSLHSLFVCGLIDPASDALQPALAELSNAISRCKFETSDSSGDEVVLLKIMAVIQDAMCGPVGDMLGDVEVCEMLETVLTTCCQMRLSEILRRSAEATMHALVRTVCSRLHVLDPAEEEAKLADNGYDAEEQDGKMNVASKLTEGGHDADTTEIAVGPASPTLARPQYGLASIVELLRVVINVLDPNDQMHTDSIRITALRILNVLFESSGSRICEFPSLSALVVDQGCKFVFQLARSENQLVLQTTLRAIATMFETMRPKLKLQQELYLAFTIDRLAPPPPTRAHSGLGRKSASASPRPSTPAELDSEKAPATPRLLVAPARGDTRELLLETLSQISRHPSFMVDLYVNYDCDMNCENMFERLIEFATKGIYPVEGMNGHEARLQNAQDLCLDLILAFVNHMASRAEGNSDAWPPNFTRPEELLAMKSRKKLVLTGMARFNAKPKTGLSFLEENRLIYTDPAEPRPISLAKFLKNSARIDKRLLGDFLSKPESIDVLKAFMSLFDFQDKSVADAMRELLETFRLPGESQQINRITETFAEVYFAAEPAEVKSQDAVYVLAYSIILLNTDLHNPQITKRMTIDDYKRNLKGVNDGSDFSSEYLQNIYDSIRKREIIMPEEHTGQAGFEYAWKELLTRSRQTGELMMCNTSLFDMDMFKTVWRPIVSAIAYAFITFDDDYIIERAIAGFRQCATLARHFGMADVFDYVVVQLSQATGLISEVSLSQVPNWPTVEVDGQSVTVSSLSVKFGTNLKGQLAAVVLFNIVNGNGNALRDGWMQIFEMFQTLFLHSLLPTRMLQMEDFLGGVSMIPLRRSQPVRQAPRSDGLLSALSSYLMTPYSSSAETLVPEATEADIENTLCTIDCITSCRLDELYSQITSLDSEALVSATRALEALAHERTVARLKQESDDVPSGSSTPEGPYTLPYDPASVFLLETMISVACQTSQYIDDIWPVLFEHISVLLSTPTQYSILLIERAVVGLLRLCYILAGKPSLRDQVFVSFDLLASLPASVASAVAEQVMIGLSRIVQDYKDIIHSQTEWNLFFALIRVTIPHSEASRQSFELITALAADGPEQRVTSDNFQGLVVVLDEYATAASIAVDAQQQGRRTQALNASNSPIVDRGKKAVDVLADLKKFWAQFSETPGISHDQIWRNYCLPLVTSLGRQSTNVSREIRHSALVHLQRILLGPYLPLDHADHTQVEELFNRVIFPLLDELLKPQVLMRDPLSLPETRLRASALLCKAFMHLEAREGQQADIRVLWIEVLDLLDRLMHVDRRDQLHEAIPESLKNIILVMNATGLLVPPLEPDERNERQKSLWAATQERVERFLPGFLMEILSAPTSPRTRPLSQILQSAGASVPASPVPS